jgi:osmotically inducible protein OsmC
MAFKRTSTAVWHGTGPAGSGALSTMSGAFKDQPYSAKARFNSEDGRAGTNPEELIAAAHAGCYTMALSFGLTGAGHEPTELRTTATVTMDKLEAGWAITGIHLDTEGKVPGVDAAKFAELAEGAKKGCPISRALATVPITLSAKLA